MTEQNPPSSEKPRYLLKSSPLVAGGKARLMSADKVVPKPATPRDVSGIEAQGYTDQAHKRLHGEPECIGPAILDSYAESARFYESQRHQQEVMAAREDRRRRTVEDRLKDAMARAKRSQIDLGHEFHICRKMLDRAHAGGRKDPPAALKVIEKIEAALDGTQLDGLHKAA